MSTRNSETSKRVCSAAEIKLRAPSLSIPAVIRATGLFNQSEVQNCSIQMQIRCLCSEENPGSALHPKTVTTPNCKNSTTTDLFPLSLPTMLRVVDDATTATTTHTTTTNATASLSLQEDGGGEPKRKKRNHGFL